MNPTPILCLPLLMTTAQAQPSAPVPSPPYTKNDDVINPSVTSALTELTDDHGKTYPFGSQETTDHTRHCQSQETSSYLVFEMPSFDDLKLPACTQELASRKSDKPLVIDLRNNTGGSLSTMLTILPTFSDHPQIGITHHTKLSQLVKTALNPMPEHPAFNAPSHLLTTRYTGSMASIFTRIVVDHDHYLTCGATSKDNMAMVLGARIKPLQAILKLPTEQLTLVGEPVIKPVVPLNHEPCSAIMSEMQEGAEQRGSFGSPFSIISSLFR